MRITRKFALFKRSSFKNVNKDQLQALMESATGFQAVNGGEADSR